MGLEETSTFTYINGDAKIKTVFLKKKITKKITETATQRHSSRKKFPRQH